MLLLSLDRGGKSGVEDGAGGGLTGVGRHQQGMFAGTLMEGDSQPAFSAPNLALTILDGEGQALLLGPQGDPYPCHLGSRRGPGGHQ